MPIKNIIAALADIEESDNSPLPQLIKPVDWEMVKKTILQLVSEWLIVQENRINQEALKREEAIRNIIKQKKRRE